MKGGGIRRGGRHGEHENDDGGVGRGKGRTIIYFPHYFHVDKHRLGEGAVFGRLPCPSLHLQIISH